MSATNDTIVAVATGQGGALAVVRLSGPQATDICDAVFNTASGGKLTTAKGYTLHYGNIVDPAGNIIDDVIVSVFRSPKSFTGEDMTEISCHASRYIQQRIVSLLIDAGARQAQPGEFTIRAFLAGKMDLSQAEAVADMIASTDRATHAMAQNQMRGGYSAEFSALRERLTDLCSLLELELDFSEEDVEFADRSQLLSIVAEIKSKVTRLLDSFSHGNALKEGIAVVIVGAPNVGKSTLLNAMLKDDRAMVSDIAGTTRDVIEESLTIRGVRFRFIDTAGIRSTDDTLERMGIERTFTSIGKSEIVIVMAEAGETPQASAQNIGRTFAELPVKAHQKLCIVLNKADKQGLTHNSDTNSGAHKNISPESDLKPAGQILPPQINPEKIAPLISTDSSFVIIPISAKKGLNTDAIVDFLYETSNAESLFKGDVIVSNSRHYESLSKSRESLCRVEKGLTDNIPADLVSQDIRETLHHLGEVTGNVTSNDVLQKIFSKFCIGK